MLADLGRRLVLAHALLLAALVSVLGVLIGLGVAGLAGVDLAVVTAAVAGAALISVTLTLATLRPLGRVAEVARAVARGEPGRRVETPRRQALSELVEAFNQMVERLEQQAATASSDRDRLAAALDSGIDALVAVDAEGRVAFANATAEELLQRTRSELLGQPLAFALADEQLVEALRSAREDGHRERCLIERPNRQYLQVVATPIAGGGDWAALAVFHDLSDARRVEQVRRDFIANVSHELRTPLASIKSVIETLEAGALADAEVARSFLSRADAEIDRLAQLVEELLELSRIESGELPLARRPVVLQEVLSNAVERLRPQAERKGVRLTLEAPADLPPMSGDAERLERVALNLIQNAIKFTPASGAVVVSAAAEAGGVTVRVADSGAGIAPEDLPRVFERFYKADRARAQRSDEPRGTGLGLAIVKHTVEAHGGQVGVESVFGRGATFRFSLPAANPS